MSTISEGLVPGEPIPYSTPDTTPYISPDSFGEIKRPDYSTPSVTTPPKDFVADGLAKFAQSKTSFATEAAPTEFNAKDIGAAMYQNADQVQNYGLSLTGNNEEIYGNLQTGWDRTKRVVGGAWALTKNQFVEQATSWGDTFNFLGDNKSAFQKSDMDAMNAQQQDLQDQFHIFHTAKDDATIFNWANIADTIQQSGYALGAMAEVIAEEAVMTFATGVTLGGLSGVEALRTTTNVVTLGKMFKRIEEAAKVTNEVGRMRKVFNGIQSVNPFLDNTLEFIAGGAKESLQASRVAGEIAPTARTIGKGFGALYRDTRELNMALAEAKSEAGGANEQITKQLTDKYKKENGKEASGDALREINETAMKAAQTDGIWNTYLIMTTNKIGMGNILGAIKPLQKLETSVAEGIIELTDKQALQAGGGKIMNKLVDASENKWMAFKQNIVRNPVGYLKTNIDEALQENLQDVIKDGTVNYYSAKYDQDHSQDPNNPMKSLHDYMIDASGNQFSIGGAKTFLSGFFTGAIIAPINHLMGNVKSIGQRITDNKAYTERQTAIKTQRGELITSYNDIYNNPLTFGYKMGDQGIQANFGEILKASAQANDIKTFNDIHDDAVRHLVMTGIHSGALDSMMERLKSYPETLSKEEFSNAFGFENTQENLDSLNHQIKSFSARAKEISQMHETVSEKFQNPFDIYHDRFKNVDRINDPEFIETLKSKIAYDDAVNNFVFMKDTYGKNMSRSISALENIKSQPGFKNARFGDIRLLTSVPHMETEINMLKAEISGLKLAPDASSKALLAQKQTRLESLSDYAGHLKTWNEDFAANSTLPTGSDRTATFNKNFETFTKKASPLFTSFINDSLKIDNHPALSNDNADLGFRNMHDYMRLQSEAGIVLDKINLLADPQNFHQFFNAHNDMMKLYYRKSVEENNKNSRYLQEIQDIQDAYKAELADLEKGIIKEGRTGTKAEIIAQINEEQSKVIGAKRTELLNSSDPTLAAAARQKEEEILKERMATDELYAQAVKAESDRIEAAQAELQKKSDALAAETEKARLKYEAALKVEQDVAKLKTLKDAQDAELARIAAEKAAIDAAHEQTKKDAEDQLKTAQEARDKSLADIAAKEEAARQKTADDARIAAENTQKVADLETAQKAAAEAKIKAEEENKALQAALKAIEAAKSYDEMADLFEENVIDYKLAKNHLVEAAVDKRQKEFLAKENESNTPKDEETEYSVIEKNEKDTVVEGTEFYTGARKPENAYTTTGLETVDINSDVIDQDPIKRLFYKTIQELADLQLKQGVSFDEMVLTEGRKGLKLTAINPTSLFLDNVDGVLQLNTLGRKSLEENTVRRLDAGTYTIEKFSGSTILVLTDEKGAPYLFNDIGKIDSEGKVLTTNLRYANLNGKVYSVNNSEGGSQVQSVTNIVAKIIKAGGKEINGQMVKTKEIIEKIVTEMQQAEFKQLYDIRTKLFNKRTSKFIFPITGITPGVFPEDMAHPTKLSAFTIKNFSPHVITDSTSALQLGGVYFKMEGMKKEVLIVRPKITAEQADTIIALLTNTDNSHGLSADEKLKFLQSMIYTKSQDIWFKVDGENIIAQSWDGKKMQDQTKELLDNNLFREAFKKKLQSKKLNLLKAYIGTAAEEKLFTNIDFDKATGKFKVSEIVYNDFVKKNFETYLKPDENKGVTPLNAHIEFDAVSGIFNQDVATKAKEFDPMTTFGNDTQGVALPSPEKQIADLNKKRTRELERNQYDGDTIGTDQPNIDVYAQKINEKFDKQIDEVINSVQEVQAPGSPSKEEVIPEPKGHQTIQEKYDAENDAINDLLKSTSIPNIATEAQIKAAEEWWSKHPLSKVIPLERLMNVVNSDALAKWTESGITLFHGANATDIYHEAFHAFSQLYLTKEQKASLYHEVQKLHPEMTNRQAEELLAEDFRKYILSDSKLVLDQRPVRNTIWRKIFNFLKQLFTGVQQMDYAMDTPEINHIKELYDKLKTGKIQKFSPSVYNIQFGKLNKGIEYTDKNKNLVTLSNAESMTIRGTIDSLIVSRLKGINLVRLNKGQAATNILALVQNAPFREAVYGGVKNSFQAIADSGSDYEHVLAQKVVDGFDKVKSYHLEKSAYLKSAGISVEYDADGNIKDVVKEGDDSQSANQKKDSAFDSTGNDKSIYEHSSPEVIQMVSSLFERDRQGNTVADMFGQPKLLPYKTAHNRIIKKVGGILNSIDMYKALVAASGEHPELLQLAQDMGDPSVYTSQMQFDLWIKFRQPYSMTRIGINNMHLKLDNAGQLVAILVESKANIDAVAKQFTSNFQSKLASPYVYVNAEGNNALNVNKIIEDFLTITQDKKGDVVSIVPGKEIEFLKNIGFDFDNKPEIIAALNKQDKLNYIAKKLVGIHNAGIEITSPIEQLQSDTYQPGVGEKNGKKVSDGENNNIKPLLDIQARFSDDYSNFSVQNAAGDKVHEISLPNQMTVQNTKVNDAVKYPTYFDLIKDKNMYKFDVNRNPLVKNSKILNSLFNIETGQRRVNADGTYVTVGLINLNGVKEIIEDGSADKGLTSNQLDSDAKHWFDVNSMMTTGKEELPRVSDKGSFFSLSVSTVYGNSGSSFDYLYFPLLHFAASGNVSNNVATYMRGSIVGELTRTGWLNEGLALVEKHKTEQLKTDGTVEEMEAQKELRDHELKTIEHSGALVNGYNERATKLTLFDDILTAATKDKLMKLVKDGVPENLAELVDKMDSTLRNEFTHYFKVLTKENWDKKKGNMYFSQELVDKTRNYLFNQRKGSSDKNAVRIEDSEIHQLLNYAHSVNSFVDKMESTKWVYGDPAFYKNGEFNKRIPSFGATKTTLALGDNEIAWVNKMGRLVARSEGIKEKPFDGTLGTRIYADNIVKSETVNTYKEHFIEKYTKEFSERSAEEIKAYVDELLSPYSKMTEADAQGLITLDSWRILKILQGDFPPAMEALYQKEVKKEALTPEDMENLLFFTVMKGQYAGPLQTERLYVPAFHKYSLMPLIPSMIRGTNMEQVNFDLMKSGHDYATFASGSKIATIGNPEQFYTGENNQRRVNLSSDTTKFTTNTIFAAHFGEQLAIAPKWKKQIAFPTQLRKLIDTGLYAEGKPVDFGGTRIQWERLTEGQKEMKSPFHGKANGFKKLIDQKSALAMEQLIKDAKIEKVDGKNVIKDFSSVVNMIKKEFENREMPDNVIDFIDLTKDNKIKTALDLSTQSQKIEGVIQSIINNRLIGQKSTGEPLIQLANTGFEKFRNATDAQKTEWAHSNDLPTYQRFGRTLADGTRVTSAMKVKVALAGDYLYLLNLIHPDGNPIETIDRLNDLIKDENWLDLNDNRKLISLTGTRIPTQELPSMEYMEVYHFLPARAGNVIIPASEIVAKSGSDFDVDKLTVIKTSINKDGSYVKTSYKTIGEIDRQKAAIEADRKGLKIKAFIDSLKAEIKDVNNIKSKEIRQLLNAREMAKTQRDFYINEIKDIIDAMTYRDDLGSYQNISANKLMNSIFGMDQTMDIKELDETFQKYYAELKSINDSYNEVDQLISDAKIIENDNEHTINEVTKKNREQKEKLNELFLAGRNIMKASDNEIAQSIRSILEMDHNFFDLVTPNSTRTVEPLADKLASRNINYDPSISKVTGDKQTTTIKGKSVPYISPTRLLESSFNDSVFLANMSGKAGVSVLAVTNTFSNLLNKVGAIFNKSYTNTKGEQVPIEVHLSHNTITKDGEQFISLSHIRDANNEHRISDIISQLMNGTLDVAKNAWLFNINGGVESLPVMDLLNLIGTPISDIAHFMTQPIIQKYSAALRAKNNLFAKVADPEEYKYFESNQRFKLLSSLIDNFHNMVDSKGRRILSYNQLTPIIENFETFQAQNKTVFTAENLNKTDRSSMEEAAMLYHYFQLEDIAKNLTKMKTAFNFDTSKPANSIAAQEKLLQFQEVYNTNLIPQSSLLSLRDHSIISSFGVQQFNIDFQSQMLPLRNHKMVNDFIVGHKDDLDIATRTLNFEKFGRTFKNDFMEHLFQEKVMKTKDYSGWFKGNNTIATQLYAIKQSNAELVKQYPLLNRLITDKSKNDKSANAKMNIKLVDALLDSDLINSYHEQFLKLIDPRIEKSTDPAENAKISTLFTELAMFGFLQSGLNKSPISWSEIIPQELYSRVMSPIVKEMTDNIKQADLDKFYLLFRKENTGTFGFSKRDAKGKKTDKLTVTNKEPYRYKELRTVVPAETFTPNKVTSNEDINQLFDEGNSSQGDSFQFGDDYASKTEGITENTGQDKNIRDKYFKDSSTQDAKTVLTKIANSEHSLAPLAQKLMRYVDQFNVPINLVDKTDIPNSNNVIANGIYYAGKNSISIAEFGKFRDKGVEGTILHEIIHAMTVRFIEQNPNTQIVKDLNKVFTGIQQNAEHITDHYGLTNTLEFMTAFFTNGSFVNDLKNMESTEKTGEYKNMWEEILHWLSKIFGMNSENAYKQLFPLMTNVFEEAHKESQSQTEDTFYSDDDEFAARQETYQEQVDQFVERNRLTLVKKDGIYGYRISKERAQKMTIQDKKSGHLYDLIRLRYNISSGMLETLRKPAALAQNVETLNAAGQQNTFLTPVQLGFKPGNCA